jgi:diguanylate cyclase (GGDEF)-like protein
VDAADEPADPGPAVRPPAPAHAPGAIDAPADESTEPHPRPVSEEEPGPTAPSPGVEGGAPAPRPPAPEPPPPADAPPPDAPPPLSFAEAVRAREERYEAETQPAEPLGDIDLVEAVLGGGGRIGPVAVRLVREQTGWDDLAFHLEEPAGTDPDVARAEVADEGRRFGTLTSRVAGADELELWAGWLARWLELGRRHELFRTESRTDELTGAANRRAMFEFLDRVLREARARRRPVTVMVFDIDDFKRFNDDHGHEAGDIILRETVALLKSVTRRADLVCRVGGDEFAVVFADLEGPRTAGSSMIEDVSVIARRFQQQVVRMRFPRLGLDAPGTLSISAGLASYPWDGSDPASLLRVADRRALESKRRGKNHITFGPGVPLLEPGDEHDAGDDDGA